MSPLPLDNNGFALVDVNLTAGAATVAGVYAFANLLPAAYRPPNVRSYPLGFNGVFTAAANAPDLRLDRRWATCGCSCPSCPNNTVVSATQVVPVN